MFDKNLLISKLELIADIMDLKGENKFKVSAFRNGALTLKRLSGDLTEMILSKEIENVKGIGKGLLSVIYEYHDKSTFSLLEELMKDIPNTLLEIFQVRGLGPKKIGLLFNELKISSLEHLELACKNGEVEILQGFSKKFAETILSEIEKIKYYRQFILIHEAEAIAQKVEEYFRVQDNIEKFNLTGDLRRNAEVVNAVEFVLLSKNIFQIVLQIQSSFNSVEQKENLIIINNFQVPVKIFFAKNETDYINLLFETTGSTNFLEKINYNKIENVNSEEEIFTKLSINFILPENREVEFLDSKKNNSSDLSLEIFNGLLHFHTTYSDGKNTLEEMIKKGRSIGYKYFAVCDHSKIAAYANGLTEERLLLQAEEIKNVSKKIGAKIFRGSEVDILANGELDFSNDTLSQLEFVVASVHSRFELSKEEMTQRIIKAVENPNVCVLGHPTGRLLLSREGYQCDIKKIIDACFDNKVAIEINANPHRLDLDWRNIFYAREKGCLFSINADAHSTSDIDLTKYGMLIARKGGITFSEVINCFDENIFNKFLKEKK